MNISMEETKLISYCHDLELDVAIDWQDLPVKLHLIQSPESTLFGPTPEGGEATLTIQGDLVICDFSGFTIGVAELSRISRLFTAAYRRYLENFYVVSRKLER